MKRRRLKKRWMFPVVLLVWMTIHSSSVTAYVEAVKEGEARPVFSEEDPLKERIEQGSKVRDKKPIDARMDRVWKAIPGYNGLVVDREETYRLARKNGSEKPIHWVYSEVPPKVKLEDLGLSPIYRGNPEKPMASLMINVAWGTEYLPQMLAILDREKVSATFFLDGSWLAKHQDIARGLIKKGHEVGNHAYTHPMMSSLSRERIRGEISRTEKLIRQLGIRSSFFAPPAGDFNQATLEEANRLGMKTVLWTVDTVDWRESSTPEWMVSRVRQGVDNGILILMHPTGRTVQALPQIIRTIENEGIKLGTVSELLSSKRVDHVEPGSSF
ncbi:polysaccharide deacetylase family protein [Salinithrix halophila]|uniref:Polysaccharide deacetylase family protein n=1 Tax=Salinithrix halophila TaxID=1485204 RepID=A0ABV8JGL0_9BACL